MTTQDLDVVGIGNAIVDVISRAEEEFLVRHAIPKGTMTLIDAERATALYQAMGAGVEASGGSVANSIAALAGLGARGGYVGRVAKDELGRIFAHDIRAMGAVYEGPMRENGLPTARSLIFVTPDAHRSMNTYLGACTELAPDDIDPAFIGRARTLYLEGYLWDPPSAKQAFLKAMDIAHASGAKVALSLSDPFCVERWRREFRDLVDRHVDILFANEVELMSLYEAAHFDDALQAVRGHVGVAALTRSEKGAVILADGEVHMVDAEPVARIVDTTGAGDLFAAGFLTGLAQGRDYHTAGRMGAICAAEVISHMGARPETDLKALVARRLAA
ncbi:MAG: adenosine kinase [Pseudomonadota bacterium]